MSRSRSKGHKLFRTCFVWGSLRVLRGRTVRCARAVRKIGYFGPVSPDGQGGCNNSCVAVHRTAQIVTQFRHLDRGMFHTENAALLSKSALQTYASLVVGGLQGINGRCPRAVQKRPRNMVTAKKQARAQRCGVQTVQFSIFVQFDPNFPCCAAKIISFLLILRLVSRSPKHKKLSDFFSFFLFSSENNSLPA